MVASYAVRSGVSFDPSPTEPVMESIFQQYERVLLESLISSFGLDFLIQDRHGGDVDTVYNVRQIGQDEKMAYKNEKNAQDYKNRGAYDSAEYHRHANYIAKNKEISEQRKAGILIDAYTGNLIAPNGKSDLDHVISAKEIHDDRGRCLAGLTGADLANSPENLQPTDRSVNRSMKEKSIDEYTEWLKVNEPQRIAEIQKLKSKPTSELTDKERAKLNKLEKLSAIDPERMKAADSTARKANEAKIFKAYYTSTGFAKDMTYAAGRVGVQMGARQVLGFIFAEMWFSVKKEFEATQGHFDLGEFFKALGRGIKSGFESAKEKYAELLSKFMGGALAGALSSLTTTLCNIFFTTAKNVVRIIRQSYASFVEAGKVLFINPDNYTFGERMKAVVKILATGASVVAGVMISDLIGKTPIATVPVLGEVVQTFCGAFVSGILSCTFLYFLDRSELMNKVFKALDGLHTIETEINYYRQQAIYFEQYAARLMDIDLEQFQKEVALYGNIVYDLEGAQTDQELNFALKRALNSLNVVIPWKGYDSFDNFMSDKKACLVFE